MIKIVCCPDCNKAISDIPTVGELRQNWTKVNGQLTEHFRSMHADEWFQRYISVSQGDFEKEPNRNKLNIVLTRNNHLSSHLGQLLLLKN